MRKKARKPLPVMTPEERRNWNAVCATVAVAVVIYLGTLVWIMIGEFGYALWTPPRGPFLMSFILMAGLAAGVLTEGRAAPHKLKRHHGLFSVVVAVLWLVFCIYLYVASGSGD